jgi:hypothetical protein
MPDLRKLGQRVKELYERVRHSPTLTSTYVTFDQDRIAGGDGLGADFEPGQHYFQVRINEMYLTHKREWFSTYDPVVFAATEFLYDRDTKMVPKVIGPNLLEQYQRELPDGVRYINTPVSGLHPYAGGDVVLVIILYQVQQAHYLRNLLGIVEKVVGAFDPSTALQSYLVMANVILDGLDAILGSDGTKPVVAVRHSIGAGDQFKPGYYALIDAPDTSVDRARLWIRDNRLCIGNSLEDSAPYREHDFCLFHIVQTDSREDVQKLPFFPIWRKTQGLAIKPEAWAEAKASFQALWRELLLSPDLTKTQKEELKESFRREMAHLRDGARELAQMGVVERGVAEVSDLEAEFRNLDKMLQRLD